MEYLGWMCSADRLVEDTWASLVHYIIWPLVTFTQKKVEECLGKCCIISFETLFGKNKKKPIHGLKQCLPMAFGGTVVSVSRRSSSPGEFTTGCCKENMKFWHHTSSLSLVLIFFHLPNCNELFYLQPLRWFGMCGCRQYPWEQNRCEK